MTGDPLRCGHRLPRCLRFIGAVSLVAAAFALPCAADEAASVSSQILPASQSSDLTKEKLEAIQREIEALRREANRLNAQENSIIATLAQYDVEYKMKTHEIELLELKQQKTLEEIEHLKMKFLELEKNLERQKSYLTQRLVEAYKLGELNYLKLMLRVNKSADLLRTYQYVTFLAKDDTRKVQMYRDSIREMERTRLHLEQENRNLALLKQDLEAAHAALLRSRQEKLQLLAKIQDRKEMHLSTMSDLRMAASQLQQFFEDVEIPQIPAAPVAGLSFLKWKGLLEWPVRGKIIREFGMYKHPKFGTTTMSNGIEIGAEEGTEVKAVFGGQVVFAEWFKGYGQSVIVSHPDGFYTLYAHNSALLVQRDDTISRGQVISKVGSTGALNGPSLYFEIRKKDQPVNPADWLRKSFWAGR